MRASDAEPPVLTLRSTAGANMVVVPLGAAQRSIYEHLELPKSGYELRELLQMSRANFSYHWQQLQARGLVERTRSLDQGHRFIYRRTEGRLISALSMTNEQFIVFSALDRSKTVAELGATLGLTGHAINYRLRGLRKRDLVVSAGRGGVGRSIAYVQAGRTGD
jgi:DNA-binding MarR family transcriptional regulator